MSLLAKWGPLATGVLATLLTLSVGAGCYDVLDPAQGSGLLNLIPDATVGTADGASVTRVRVWVDLTLPLSQRVVTMNTTAGTFTLGGKTTVTLTPDSDGVATAYLQAPRDSCVAQISASADTTTGTPPLTIRITYLRAQAESIDVIADSFSVKAGVTNALTITAHLRRNLGRPSPFLRVEFRAMAVDSSWDNWGVFTTALPSDSSGRVTVKWTSADTLSPPRVYVGRVTIRAWTRPDTTRSDTTVSGRATIWVMPPETPPGVKLREGSQDE